MARSSTIRVAEVVILCTRSKVPERRLSKRREAAIVSLLDDESPLVRKQLLEELKRLDDIGLTLLRKVARGANRILASHANSFIEALEGPDPSAEFVEFIRSMHYELESGCILLSRVAHPQLEVDRLYEQLEAYSRRVRELLPRPHSPYEACKVINRVLFHELGFRGNREDFDDPANSFLSDVLRRRKGIPITLSSLYILVARRCGVELEPIGMPGRFLVGCFNARDPFFLDPFERGAFRSEEDLLDILSNNHIEPDPRFLMPVPVGEVLSRMCRNLVRQYSLRNNPGRAKQFITFIREFDEVHRREARP